jgi:hypothetical protein
MTYAELQDLYKLQENANEVEHELSETSFFEDYFSKDFTVSILPEEDNETPNMFYLITRIQSMGSRLSEDHAEEICDAVIDKFFELIASTKNDHEVDELRDYFCGPQLFLNDNQLY